MFHRLYSVYTVHNMKSRTKKKEFKNFVKSKPDVDVVGKCQHNLFNNIKNLNKIKFNFFFKIQ